MTRLIGYWHARGRVGFALRIVANRCVRYDHGWREQGFVQALTFGARPNYTKSNRLRCSCTKHVPFRYRFDEKPAVIVRLTVSRFSLARILSRPRQAGKAQPKCSPRNPACFWPPRTGRCLPDAHQRNLGPFPPQETAFYVESERNISAME
jgi:hypothetical protein